MPRLWKFLSVYVLLTVSVAVYGQQALIEGVRYRSAPDRVRLVFDTSSAVSQDVFFMKKPARLILDFKETNVPTHLKQPSGEVKKKLVRLRVAKRDKKDVRIVLDLKNVSKYKAFYLKPNKTKGHRVVVDIYKNSKDKLVKSNKVANKQQPLKLRKKLAKKTIKKKIAKKSIVKKVVKRTVKKKLVVKRVKDIVIAIDAGHGGKDPGAKGANGTQEKKVVFQIAKKLAALINKKPGMKAVLVRKGDYYINLRKRMEIARTAKADLFLSIHADAFHNNKVKGASVFTLSQKGEKSEANIWLAKKANNDVFVGGVTLSDKDKTVASVIMDLSQNATKDTSQQIASYILNNLKGVGHLHKSKVQNAAFMVLKSPDIPSILIETAFISNPLEERQLKSKKHQQKMARAIYKGVVSYFDKYPPEPYLASNTVKVINKKHIISRGDTLSEIAYKYGVSMKAIKTANALSGGRILIGQVLKIPAG